VLLLLLLLHAAMQAGESPLAKSRPGTAVEIMCRHISVVRQICYRVNNLIVHASDSREVTLKAKNDKYLIHRPITKCSTVQYKLITSSVAIFNKIKHRGPHGTGEKWT
jgi:hypothetical protein